MIYSVFDAHESALRSIRRVVTETAPPTPVPMAAAAVVKQLQAGNVLVVTGAGVSTDSGIPDYRGPGGSLRHHRPMTYQEFRGDDHARRRYWARSYLGWRHLAGAQPNYVHRCLSTLEAAGHLTGIVTQNVDGLHQAAGSCTVIPLHGDLATVICLSCGAREDRREYDARMTIANPGFAETITLDPATINPDGDVQLADSAIDGFHVVGCARCGSALMKPDVVYFGEPVPRPRKQQVADLIGQSDSVLVVGSSLAVMSGMRIILDAKKQRKQVSVINGGPGRADDRVDVLWRTDLATAFRQIMPQLV